MEEVYSITDGPPPEINLSNEKNNGLAVLRLINDKLVSSVHDISSGGLLLALAEMTFESGYGIKINKELAFEWFTKAANKFYKPAEYKISMMLLPLRARQDQSIAWPIRPILWFSKCRASKLDMRRIRSTWPLALSHGSSLQVSGSSFGAPA